MIPPELLDEIRARVSLVEIIGRDMKLRVEGREYVGLCPFHSEKTPSFTIVEEKAPGKPRSLNHIAANTL